MTTLVVQLPPRDPAVASGDWQLPALPFVYFDAHGRRLRSGVTGLDQLPRADTQVLLVAPSDVLLLRATVPPLSALRLRQALPNLVEEQLVQDAARCHFALSSATEPDGTRLVAVVDRAWMRFVLEQFGAGDGRRLRAVPLITCLPEVRGEEGAVTLVDGPGAGIDERAQLAVQGRGLPYGLALPRERLAQSIGQLEGGASLRLQYLEPLPGVMSGARDALHEGAIGAAEAVAFELVAARALEATLDLCQFEFAARRWQGVRAVVRRWRVPLALAAAGALVCIVGLNLQWLMLARDRANLAERAEQMLREAFPRTTVVLDAPLQMTRNLETLRATAGELAPSDFLFLAGRLGEATGPLAAGSVAALDYADRTLTVTFRPGFSPDPGVSQALARAGLSVRVAGAKWSIKSDGQ